MICPITDMGKGHIRSFGSGEHDNRKMEERAPAELKFKVQDGNRKKRKRDSCLADKQQNSISTARWARTSKE